MFKYLYNYKVLLLIFLLIPYTYLIYYFYDEEKYYFAALSQIDGFISISIDLPYEVEGNLENVQKALTIAFSKTK